MYSGDGVLLTSTKVVVRWSIYVEDLNPADTPSGEEAGLGDPGMGCLIFWVQSCLSGRAPGVDKIRPEFLKALNVVGLSWLT